MKLNHSVSGAVRQFSYWIANGTVGYPLLEGIDYFYEFRESPSLLETVYFTHIGRFENEVTQLAEPTEQEIRQRREEIEEAKKEKSRAYHREYSKEYRAQNLEKRREYERIKAREYRARKKAQAAAAPVA